MEIFEVYKALEAAHDEHKIVEAKVKPWIMRDLLQADLNAYMNDKELTYKTKSGATIKITANNDQFDDISYEESNDFWDKMSQHIKNKT